MTTATMDEPTATREDQAPVGTRHEAMARAEQQRIRDQINHWHAERAKRVQAIERAKADGAQQVLAGTATPAHVAQNVTQLQAEVETIDGLLGTLREQYDAMGLPILEGRRADLLELREQKQAEVDELDAKTHVLMEQIRKIQGPDARLAGETQSLYLLDRINALDHSLSDVDYRIQQHKDGYRR